MPLFGKQVNLEEVRKQYVQFIATIMGELRQKGQQIKPMESAQYVKQFVPRAKQIITPSIAKQMDKDTSHDQIVVFTDPDFLATLPENIVTIYLMVLLFTLEDTLGQGQTFLRYSVVIFGGSDFYKERGEKLLRAKDYTAAEKEIVTSIWYARLWVKPNRNVMIGNYYLGLCKANQGQNATTYFRQAIEEYAKLSPKDQSDSFLQKVLASAKEQLA